MSNLEQFGKYILLEKLAAGGMAEVYLAKSNGANGVSKFVAVKRILPQFSDNEEFIEMFKEEANVAINLNHSNVVSIYDFGIEKGQFYLVMEFVEGRNLRQILNELKKANKSISIEQSVFIVKEAAAGLDHAHRCSDSKSGKPLNITHRDMSPQNIMISFEGESKVIDFGIAKAEKESEATKAGTLKGKFAYMSPEQSEGLPIDPRTDVFALGIILWELLANDRLFTGSNEAAILRKVRDCQIPPIRKINPLVPPELERIVTKALAKDKNVRYQTAANLQKDLNRFLNMQYPDFASQDFSTFIKDCFKSAFAEGREKLVRYSKVENLVEVLSITETQPPIQQNQAAADKKDLPAIPELIRPPVPTIEPVAAPNGIGSQEKLKISLDGIRNVNVSNRQKQNEVGQSTRVTQVTQMSKTNSYNQSLSSIDSQDMIMKFLFIAVLGFASFFGFKNFIKPNGQNNAAVAANKINSAKKSLENQGQIEMGSTAKVTVSMSSTPSGARIFVDGKDTGQLTPSIVSVVANKDINISMVKDGFSKYESTKMFEQTSSFSATLQKQINGGYVNIYVVNGGARPAVFVNGQRLSEELPIKKYRIPANTETTIYAENAITRLADQVKIKVGSDQITDVELILGRTPTASAEKK
jgi:eukaryotic-like serine/threonine-protein kinase